MVSLIVSIAYDVSAPASPSLSHLITIANTSKAHKCKWKAPPKSLKDDRPSCPPYDNFTQPIKHDSEGHSWLTLSPAFT